jgi:hypothetical protein
MRKHLAIAATAIALLMPAYGMATAIQQSQPPADVQFSLAHCAYGALQITEDLQASVIAQLKAKPDKIVEVFSGLSEKIIEAQKTTNKNKGDTPPQAAPVLPAPYLTMVSVRARSLDKDTGNMLCAASIQGNFGSYYGVLKSVSSLSYKLLHTAEGGVFIEYEDPFIAE